MHFRLQRTLCSLLSCSASLLSVCAQSDVRPDTASRQARDLAAHDYLRIINDFRPRILGAMREEGIPGLAVALVTADTVLWSQGFGFTDDDRRVPVNPRTMFSIQSMSKAFTATLVMIAAQEGLVDLHTPISAYLPGFTVKSTFEEHPERKITLTHLLSHTAGFAHEAPVGNNYGEYDVPLDQHIWSIPSTWLKYPVGQRYEYSNLGIDLAGYILQVRSGVRFEEYAKSRLLDPLGMSESSFDRVLQRSYASRAVGHSRTLARFPLEIPMVPAGSLYTNADELARFIQFHLRRGRLADRELLGAAWFDTMYTIPSMVLGQTDGYALGITRSSLFGTYCMSHGGGGFGFSAQMRWYPELNVGVLVLSNLAEAQTRSLATTLVDRVVQERLPSRPPIARIGPDQFRPIPATGTMVRSILGTYCHSEGGILEVCEEDGVPGVIQGGKFFPLEFIDEREAFTQHNGAVRSIFRFILDERGKPLAAFDYYGWPLTYAFDHAEGDGRGPDRSEWRNYTGRYRLLCDGVPVGMVTVKDDEGYLYASGLRLREIEPGVFMNGGGDVLDLRSRRQSMGNVPMEKIRVSPLVLVLLGGCLVVFVWVLAGWPMASLLRRRRDLREKGKAWKPALLPALAAWLTSALSLGVLMMLGMHPYLIGYGFPWNHRLPVYTKVLMLIPSAILVLVCVLVVATARIRKSSDTPSTVRLNYALVTGAGVIVTVILLLWNLVVLPV